MRERSTDDLGQELMGAPNIDAYIHNNEAFFSEQSITESLAELYERKAVSKAALEMCIRDREETAGGGGDPLREECPAGPEPAGICILEKAVLPYRNTVRSFSLSPYRYWDSEK